MTTLELFALYFAVGAAVNAAALLDRLGPRGPGVSAKTTALALLVLPVAWPLFAFFGAMQVLDIIED